MSFNIKNTWGNDKHNYDPDFRFDGYRGECPRCRNMFSCGNKPLREAMIKHFEEYHPDIVFYAVAYMNRLEKEIEEEFKK